MTRGIPSALLRRGTRKQKPPVDRNAHVYQDPNAPDNDLIPTKKVEPVKAAPVKAPKVEPVKAAPKVEPVKAPEPVVEPEPEPEAPAWSMDNTKAELLAAAEEMGLKVDGSMKKADILAAIESA